MDDRSNKREFREDLTEEKKELFSSHALDVLTVELSNIIENYDTEYQIAAIACLLRAVSHKSADAPIDDPRLCSTGLHARGLNILYDLLNTEGWSMQEALNIFCYALVTIAVNIYTWNRE